MEQKEAIDRLGNWLDLGTDAAKSHYLDLLAGNVRALSMNPTYMSFGGVFPDDIMTDATRLTHATIAALEVGDD